MKQTNLSASELGMLETVKQILKLNPDFILAGSLSLKAQGINTKQPASDIDIYVPPHCEFKPILTGLNVIEPDENTRGSNTAEEEKEINLQVHGDKYHKKSFVINGFDVDFFSSVENNLDHTAYSDEHDIYCVYWKRTIHLKTKYALCGYDQSAKHIADLIYFYENNSHKLNPVIDF